MSNDKLPVVPEGYALVSINALRQLGWKPPSEWRDQAPVSATVPEAAEPFGYVTVRRLSKRFANHVDQFAFYPADQRPYLDNVDECHTVYTAPDRDTQQALSTARAMVASLTAELTALRGAGDPTDNHPV